MADNGKKIMIGIPEMTEMQDRIDREQELIDLLEAKAFALRSRLDLSGDMANADQVAVIDDRINLLKLEKFEIPAKKKYLETMRQHLANNFKSQIARGN